MLPLFTALSAKNSTLTKLIIEYDFTHTNTGTNAVSGTIPSEIGELTGLKQMDLCTLCLCMLEICWVVMNTARAER